MSDAERMRRIKQVDPSDPDFVPTEVEAVKVKLLVWDGGPYRPLFDMTNAQDVHYFFKSGVPTEVDAAFANELLQRPDFTEVEKK